MEKIINISVDISIGLLQIVFIVLKLCGVIQWSWWLVMLPSLIMGGILILILLFIGIGILFVIIFKDI